MPGALEGLLVISVEQAVAAPYCAARLADAGARVIKIERPEGDFARAYDAYVHGQSSYFVWLNRGKQSVTLDFKDKDDLALLHRMIAKADVLIQNLAPGAAERAGFGSAAMRARNKRLITVDISGYGEHGPYRNRRAYDLLVQAESGLASITGTAEGAGPRRHLGHRHRHRHVRPRRRAGGAAGPPEDRRRPRHRGLAVLRHGGVDDRAGAGQGLLRLRLAAARAHPSLHRALRRLPDGRQGAGPDLDPERPRVRAAVPRRARPAGPGEGSRLRHQQGTQRAARRHQRHRPEEFRQPELRRSRRPARRRADRLGAREFGRRSLEPSAAAARQLRHDRR